MQLAIGSLTRTVALQFVAVMAPLALVLVYQLVGVVRYAGEAQVERTALATALRAQRHYKSFLDGVDDGAHIVGAGARSRQALDATIADLRSLRSPPATNLWLILDDLETLADTVDTRRVASNLRLDRQKIDVARRRIDALVARHEQRAQQASTRFLRTAERQPWVVSGALATSLLVALASLVLLTRGLVRPLRHAVTLAQATAAGRFDDDAPVQTHALDGLLGALSTTRAALSRSFASLARSERRLANTQRMATIGDWELVVATQVITMSETAAAVLGLADRSTVTSGFPLQTIQEDDRPLVARAIENAAHAGTPFDLDFRIVLGDGAVRHVHGQGQALRGADEAPHLVMGTVQDVSARKLADQKAHYLALHDHLTGLPNRTFFQAHADHALAASVRAERHFAVLFVDVDGFKRVNDTFGHAAGDAVLKEVGHRLQSCVRASDVVSSDRGRGEPATSTLFRMGGDEFTLLLASLKSPEDAAVVARRIQVSLRAACVVDGRAIPIDASIGIAVAPGDGDDVSTLMKHADIAMYHSKTGGGGRFQFYSDSMQSEVFQRMAFEAELVTALADGQFILHYQPKVHAKSGAIVGVEALVRWNHPTRGLLGPGEFIPVAERIGLIHQIGEWVLHTACREVKGWHDAGLTPVAVSVNISTGSAAREDIVDQVTTALARSGLGPCFLEVELTESVMMDGAVAVIERMRDLKNLGVKLSLDDFGTGYSCLAYLRRLPVDTLKIDRSFVQALDTPDGMALAATIVAMAKHLSLRVVAEGVETLEQATTLKEMKCDILQGFLFGRPAPPDEVAKLIRWRFSLPWSGDHLVGACEKLGRQ